MSNFTFLDLTDEVRDLIQSEITADASNNVLYLSSRLNDLGKKSYPDSLTRAVKTGDAETLQIELESGNFFNSMDTRQGKPIKMASNAAQLLAQSEFNRFYIRGVCLKAIKDGQENVEVYRSRQSSWTRPESENKIGTLIKASDLLEDLRTSIGTEPKILPEINSGLSVKL
ncbi:hypothetical protein EON73_01675 [bacterium]|nr:MAG: hypothetical protein EON73_01675 [bacterium]